MMVIEQQTTHAEAPAVQDAILFARLAEGIVAIQVLGRGSFQNSVEVKSVADAMFERNCEYKPRFVFDMVFCSTMDSTFMGVMASIGLRQLRESSEQMIVLNANAQVAKLLDTLGLVHFIDVRKAPQGEREVLNCSYKKVDTEGVSRKDRIVHMIEAHKNLCEADPENNIRFESVLKYLEQSLTEEKE